MNIRARLAKLERANGDSGDEFSRMTEDELCEEIRKYERVTAERLSKELGIPAEDITLQHMLKDCEESLEDRDLNDELAKFIREEIFHGCVKSTTESYERLRPHRQA